MSTRLVERWNSFWFALEPTQTLARVRIFFGLILYMKMSGLHGLFRFPHWTFALGIGRQDPEKFLFDRPFRMAVPGFEWLPGPSPVQYQALDNLLLWGGLFFAVGLGTRLVGPLLALALLYKLLLSLSFFTHHLAVLTAIMLVLGLSRCGDHASLDRVLFRRGEAPPLRMALPRRLLQVFTSALYLSTTLGKLNEGWFSGRIMEVLAEYHYVRGIGPFVLSTVGPRFVCLFTLLAEGTLTFALWSRRTRRIAIVLGIFLHLGIDSMMDVTTFSYQMLALYAVFIDPATGAVRVLFDRRRRPHRAVRCVARLLDWLGRLKWLDVSDPGARAEVELVMGGSAAEVNRLTLVLPNGHRLQGRDAWCELGIHLPATFVPAFFAGLPATSGVFRKSALR